MNTPLQLLRGTISNLVVDRGEENFVHSTSKHVTGGAVAIGLAAAGLAGAATGTLLATTGGGDSVEFFTCTVDGTRIAGRFTKASFKIDDLVEVAAERQTDGTFTALAVRRPSDQTVWMFPHCSRGQKMHLHYAMKATLWVFLLTYGLAVAFFGSIVIFDSKEYMPSFLLTMAAIDGMLSLAVACHLCIRTALRWRPFVQKAESIFTAFGYRDPSRVDMEQQHKKYLRQHGGKWPYLCEAPWVFRYADAS